MKIVFCFAGKTFRGAIQELQSEYRKRILKYAGVEIIEAKTLKKQTRDGVHVLLDPRGKEMDSVELSTFIEEQQNTGTKHIFLYTGAPEGHDAEFSAQSEFVKLSMSRMTFNHQLIRVMLMEQIYRAFTIINREPYHK